MILAAYTVALNEERHVARWLHATRHFDYRLVVDTGSTDGTPEALQAAGVSVYRATVRPWRFDQARNTALALLPADVDVCLTIDMDELIADDMADTIRANWGDAHQGWVPFDTGSTWLAPRLHSRHGWVWKYPIHEVLTWVGEGQPRQVTIGSRMWHDPDPAKSRAQYLPMLQQAIREYPTDHRMWTYLVREYGYRQQWQPLLAAAGATLDLDGWDVEQAAVHRWAADAFHHLGNDTAAREHAERALCIVQDAETWQHVALAAYWQQDWPACLRAAMKAHEAPPSTHYLADATIHAWRAADLASLAAFHMGDTDAAIRWVHTINLDACPDAARIRANLAWFRKDAA